MENFMNNPVAQRLIREWREHGKIVLAVDFDDTICIWKMRNQAECDATIKIILEAQKMGTHIVIFTACKPERYSEIRQYCESKGIIIASINENPIELPYGNDRKIYYNHLLDDRAGLEFAEKVLEYVTQVIFCDKHKNDTFDF